MVMVQTEAQLWPIAAKVGVPKERASTIKANSSAVTNVAGLRVVVRAIGYYNEKADHLVAAGVTFA